MNLILTTFSGSGWCMLKEVIDVKYKENHISNYCSYITNSDLSYYIQFIRTGYTFFLSMNLKCVCLEIRKIYIKKNR